MSENFIRTFFVATAITLAQAASAQETFHLNVHTDEVSSTFSVEDENGRPVTDLTLNELRILDNGHPPERVTLFLRHEHLPLRVALLFDESASMQGMLRPRAIAQRMAETVLQNPVDQALIGRFDFDLNIRQDWVNDHKVLTEAAGHVTDDNRSRCCGTALWDTLYRACRDHFSAQVPGSETSSNAILLFTDGMDNRSHALPQDVVDECQQRQTAIYSFVGDEHARMDAGQKALRSLAELTGGRVFYGQDNAANLATAALTIDQDLRNGYTVVYRPAKIKHNGSFHTIKLACTDRAIVFSARSGYYASK